MDYSGATLPVTALLLAGGASRRMGRDKATVTIGKIPLWERQLAMLRAVSPANILISGTPNGPYAHCGVEIVSDQRVGLGPLAGIVAGLRHSSHELLLVLAIDLPRIPSNYLSALVQEAVQTRRGIVPKIADRFEPLAAVYPRTSLPLADRQLQTADRSMQRFVRTSIDAGLVVPREVADNETAFFVNLNTEADRKTFECG